MTVNLTKTDHRLAAALAGVPGLVAVAIGGSRATGFAGPGSDTDVYAFFSGALATVCVRHAALSEVADEGSLTASDAFGPEDHFTVDGEPIEIVYLDVAAVEDSITRVHSGAVAADGFSTAFLHTVAVCEPLRDTGELARLKQALTTYPEATRARILAHGREVIAEWSSQLIAAQTRGDVPMVMHRRATIQAVLFDVLFAVNRRYHPGEKRMLDHVDTLATRPHDFARRWTEACLLPADSPELPRQLGSLVDDVFALA